MVGADVTRTTLHSKVERSQGPDSAPVCCCARLLHVRVKQVPVVLLPHDCARPHVFVPRDGGSQRHQRVGGLALGPRPASGKRWEHVGMLS